MSQEKIAFDPERFKDQERAGFNLVAHRYEQIMSLSRPSALRMLELAKINKPGLQVLDLATGPGMVARMAANINGPTGQVTGIDIAEETIQIAQKNAIDEGLSNINFQIMDAENLEFNDNVFDRALCSFGLMHFPNPEKALNEILRVLKPGGYLAVSVWGEAAEVPFIQLALTVITRNFPPPKVERPSMFRFGKGEILQQLLESSGFQNTISEKVKVPVYAESAQDYWSKFLDVAGITTIALAKQPPEVRQKLEADTAPDLLPYHTGTHFDLTSSTVVASGNKPG